MDIRKRKIRGHFALAALIIILSLCLAMALSSVSAVAPSEVANAAVAPGTASVLNLSQNGAHTDHFSSVITGGQNEYIYFGTNVTSKTENEPGYNNTLHTGAIKWRVLSGNDTKYSNGNILLWADYQLGSGQYNLYYNNPNFAYYGTSMIRAKLNGGTYLSNVSNTTAEPKLDQQVRVADSWLHKLFGENERANIIAANSMETKCWGFISNTYATTGIVGTGGGQYNPDNVNNVAGTYARVDGNSVIETIPVGDSLFLLDYYDINNVDYGFSDNGTTYANKINASWTPNSAGYLGYYDNGSITGDYLKFSDDIAIYYWIRPAGRSSTAFSGALNVLSSGFVDYALVTNADGVRPAFNFSPANIIYATAAAVSSNNSTFASVKTISSSDGKPAYKVYIKTDDYVNYNESMSNRPSISTTSNSITVTKAGQSGSAIFLLADKSGSGVVEYQATASFDSNSVATATLPSNVKASDYVITVLFTDSINGENYAESITGSFTTSSLSIPKAISADYNGSIQTLETLKSNLDWYHPAFADPSIVEVEYLTSTGSVLSSNDYPKNAGKYKIRFTIVDTANYQWPDKETDANLYRTIDFEINQIEMAYPSITGAKSKPYSGGNDVRFQLDGFDSNSMELSWKESYDGVGINVSSPPYSVSAQAAGTYELVATIKPDQAINYKFSSTPKIEVEVTPAQLVIEKMVASGGGSNSAFSISEGTASISVDIFVDVNGAPLGSDVVPITIYIPYGSSDIDVSQGISLDASALPSTSYQLTNQQIINLGGLFEGSYSFGVKTTNKNYTVDFKKDGDTPSPTLTVLPAGQRTNILWKLYEGNSERSNYRTVTELNETGVKNLSNTLTYSGEQFRFEVELPNGYSLDSGYTVEKISGQGSADGKDAGTYRTTIKLAENNQEYSIEWTIERAKFDLSEVKWLNKLEYTGSSQSPSLENLPNGLEIRELMGANDKGTAVNTYGEITVRLKIADGFDENNYILPEQGDEDSYEGNFTWTISWEIVPVEIKLNWEYKNAEDSNGTAFRVLVLSDSRLADKVDYEYYETNRDGEIINDTPYSEDEIEVSATQTKYYKALPKLQSIYEGNYQFPSGADLYSSVFSIGGGAAEITVSLASNSYVYTGKPVALRFPSGTPTGSLTFTYYEGDAGVNKIDSAPTTVGTYWVEVASNNSSVVLSGETKFQFTITKSIISTEWNTTAKPPVLRNLTSIQLQQGIEYEYYDADMHKVEYTDLNKGGTFYIRAVLKDNVNFEFDNGEANTEPVEFTVKPGEELRDPSDINNPNYDFEEDPNLPEDPNDPTTDPDDNDKNGVVDFDKIGQVLKEWWQVIASVISIILIIVFTSKGIGYANKRKENKRAIESKYNTFYAVSGTGLFGLSMTNWTIIACVLMGLAVLSFVFMLIEKRGYKKSQRNLDDAKEEFSRKKEEDMKMMFMHMMGGNPNGGGQAQGGYAYAGQSLGADEIRGIVSETMTAMLPNFQQYLPQQASNNEELVEKLLAKTEKNEETIQKLMKKIAEQPTERVVEREVAATSVSDELLEKLINKLQPAASDETILKVVNHTEQNDETIKQLLKNQEKLMEKILELSANQQPVEPQVVEKIVKVPVEKIVEKEVKVEVPVEVEKVVEKVVEVPVEKIVEKEVPVEVEKIVEKEVVKEVPVEKIVEVPVEVEKIVEVPVEVEKVVEKIVEIPAQKPAPKAKVVAPRLTLDEAYAKLSAKQKKIFDTLKDYALSKDKCKEKKSTYSILLGQSSVNPLVKLTIKKDTTVALFKMEDEFMKDIRRNATNDGTKVKVKETELVVADMQALATAKEMVDLREDQIERYNEYLKEQRSMKNK